MAGAYTALPPEDSTPDVPDGWDDDWTFPGPAPPGYEFDYGFDIDAPSFVVPGSSTSGTVTLTDHDTYVTSTPDGGSTIELSAKFADTQEEVTITGTALYSYSSLEDDFSGAEFSFTLGVTEADNGRTVTITAESTPFSGYDVHETANIVVAVPTADNFKTVLTATWTTNQPQEAPQGTSISPTVRFDWPYQYATCSAGVTYGYGETLSISEKDGVSILCAGYSSGSAVLNITLFESFRIMYSLFPFYMSTTMTFTLKTYINDSILETYSFSTSDWKQNGSVWFVIPATATVYEY